MEASVLGQPYPITAGPRASLLRIHGDEWLIAQMRRGNEAAFEALVERYRPRLLAFCRHMLRSHEDGEDVLQEVFANAYRAIMSDRREINARPWLYRIARNMCLKHLARRRIKADGTLEDLDVAGTSTTVDTVRVREEFRQVVADVRELPETQRSALLLREIEGLSYDQIAEAMDTSVPSVKSLLVRARVALAETAEGRLLACDAVQLELRGAAEGACRISSPVRRHMRECDECAAFSIAIRPARRPAAAALFLAPLGVVQDLIAKLGIGAVAGGSTAAGGASIAGGAAAGGAASGTLTLLAGKAAVAVATATLVAAGASDLQKVTTRAHHARKPAERTSAVQPVVAPGAVIPRAHDVGPQAVTPPAKPISEPTAGKDGAGDPAAATPGERPTTGITGTDPVKHDAGVPNGTTDDPSRQPIGGPEPVEPEGFSGGPSQPGAAQQPAPASPPASSGTAPAAPGTTYSEPAP